MKFLFDFPVKMYQYQCLLMGIFSVFKMLKDA